LYKCILFDFDGTLIDTNDLIIQSLRETAMKFLGRNLTPEDLHSLLGKYLAEQMRCLSESHWEDMMAFYADFYNTRQEQMTKEFPGIRQMLEKVKAHGCKTAVVSAKEPVGICHGLERFQIATYIDVIISAHDIQHNKPHPEPALKALQALGNKAEEALMVGDSPYDILCGKNAGIASVLVNWTIFPRDQLLKLQPDYILHTPDELLKIIKGDCFPSLTFHT
jgi:pyrophosphatase PpaX